jgi:uroporphyrinogen decarboxylase
MQERCGDLVWMPAQWGATARVTWFFHFGYEHFFCIVGLYPDRARKLMEIGGAQARCRCRLIARAVQEGLYPKAMLFGEDICTQRGPMISPAFLEEHYMPQVAYSIEPLLDVGCKPVWHSDGDVRGLMDMLIEAGVQGFQGFQPECGMLLEEIVEKRTRDGEPLLIFGSLAVTTQLPVLSADEVQAEVRRAIDVCRGRASLVLFTSNTINPDVPLANIAAMHEAVRGG